MPEDDKYDVLEKIGHGSFGIIRKVKRKSDGYILCRKEISYSKMSAKEREQLQAELSILKELHHPNIVAYFERDHLKASQDLHLYMEYCGNGDLGRVIQDLKHNNQLAQEEFVWSIFTQIVGALYRCHYGEDAPPAGSNVMGLGSNAKPRGNGKPMILHRDLKPENIFLDKDNSVKLGDFGLSKILQSHDFASTYVGTPFYMSPEICKAEQYGPHSDIWALGCIIYELCAKAPPFNAKTHFELIQKIKAGRYPEIPSVYSGDLRNVIQSCLQVIPNNRPDTAKLLNIPCVKMMRKEQEIVRTGQSVRQREAAMKHKEDLLESKLAEVSRRLAEVDTMRKELDAQLRREWEVKAHLEIERQVRHHTAAKTAELQTQFEEEVNGRVERALAKYPSRLSTSPRMAPRSSTPTMPSEPQHDLFPAEQSIAPIVINSLASTLGTDSEFASGTDISSLSLDDNSPVEEPTIQPKPAPAPAPAKRSRRAPLARAQTMFAVNQAQPPPSPMDVQMGEPSPAPASVAGLNLSPRKGAVRGNIFAAAKDKDPLNRLQNIELPPSPTEEDWTGALSDDDLPVLPSPTRARSASGSRPASRPNSRTEKNGTRAEDPFKALAGAQRPILKPSQRLASAPTLAPTKTTANGRPASAVPIVATSPTRAQKTKSVDLSASPTRRAAATTATSGNQGFVSKKRVNGVAVASDRLQALRGNAGGVQGRTLVELQQARGIPISTQSDNEDAGKKRYGYRSPVKSRSNKDMSAPAIWDPEVEMDMPSPFIRRGKTMVK